MKQISNFTGAELNNQIFEFCRHVAGKTSITAIAQIDKFSMEAAGEKAVINVLVVIRDFQPRIMSYIKTVNERPVYVFAVDQWIFERDIERGFLGEAIASKLVFPHSDLFGKDYLREKEVTLKKRLTLELLENLASNFPELAPRIQIKPQYFLYEVLLNRTRVFPLFAYDLPNVLNGITLNEEESLESYNIALRQLEAEGQIYFSGSYIKISKRFIDRCQDPKIKIINLTKNAPRTLFTSFFEFFPHLMSVVSQNAEAFMGTQTINWRIMPDSTLLSVDPQKYVFFQTSEGLVSLSDKMDLKGYVQKMLLNNQSEDINVEPIGGRLNDVYLIVAHSKGIETKVIAKRFKDWSGFKWFPLTVWSLGTRVFAVSAQARLAKELAISEALRGEGFNVPKVLRVSYSERLVFMEYIDGENLSQAIKRIAAAKKDDPVEKELSEIFKAGTILSQVHAHNFVLGDTKPENMLIKQDGTMFLIDFEQAARGGDKTWDVAVFLYYAGHYIQPIYGNDKAELIAKTFINGYLTEGGDVEVINKAGLPKYTRIFSVLTMWTIISAISNVCKDTEALK